MTGNCSGLAKSFHGWSKTRLSRILAGEEGQADCTKCEKHTLCCILYSFMAVSKLRAWPIAVFKMVEDTDNQKK